MLGHKLLYVDIKIDPWWIRFYRSIFVRVVILRNHDTLGGRQPAITEDTQLFCNKSIRRQPSQNIVT